MASPQTENGFTKIANELLEQIVATPLPDNEHRMFLFIIRKTYGFSKKQDKISLTQFEKALKRSRPVISKTLKNLILRKMVVRTPLLVISVEKDYEKWVVAPPLLVKNKSKYGSPAPTFASSPAPTHKRNIKESTKETRADKPLKDKFEIDKYPKQNYAKILTEYQRLKGVKLQGDEFLPPMAEIKRMFKSSRTVEQINETMAICEENYEDWAMSTVRMKIADVVGGKLRGKNINKSLIVKGTRDI